MLKAIFFDLDDTLLWDKQSIQNAFVATCKHAEECYGIDPVQLEEAVREAARKLYSSYETFEFTKMIGINPFEGLWGNFCDEKADFKKLKAIVPGYRKNAWTLGLASMGVDDPDFGYELGEQFPKERRKAPIIFEDTFTTLEALKGNYRLLLLTNGSPELQKTKLALTPELAPYFEQICISGDFGRGKPDPSLFLHALSLMALKKDEAIMVGDNLMTDILGAARAGMKTVWINRDHKERNEVVPTYEIHRLEELFPILKEFNGAEAKPVK